MTSPAPGDVDREFFCRDLLDPWQWMRKADALNGSAAKFEHELNEAWTNVHVSFFAWRMIDVALPVYLMLAAYAVENILKGMLVLENRSTYEQYVNLHLKLPPGLKGHDLL